MATDDVLERFEMKKIERQEHWGILSVNLQRLWDLTCDLAAEVRELRSLVDAADRILQTPYYMWDETDSDDMRRINAAAMKGEERHDDV